VVGHAAQPADGAAEPGRSVLGAVFGTRHHRAVGRGAWTRVTLDRI
jgi:hypothetical protein